MEASLEAYKVRQMQEDDDLQDFDLLLDSKTPMVVRAKVSSHMVNLILMHHYRPNSTSPTSPWTPIRNVMRSTMCTTC